MAGSKADFLENAVLNWWLGNVASAPPATVYIALFNTTPGDDGTGGVEVSGGSYARVAVTNNTTNFPTVSDSSKKNGTEIVFVTATADWNTINGFGIYSALTGGNLLWYGDLTTPKSILNGDTAKFAVNAIVISES